ncbi:amino-acid acetyltransferase domain protein [Burkholderia pseudomallei TSV5]|nr:amino-acid acetyltransferase domain protein [Burkholderia pseudomallei]KGD57489.1 amino-acid acetyltransferase domain protein [Burkholderia pseudomallei]KGX50632.1 amino-acid acetyltransferase domain protein [Burkholderia pseudomallei TSV5]
MDFPLRCPCCTSSWPGLYATIPWYAAVMMVWRPSSIVDLPAPVGPVRRVMFPRS